MTNHDRALAELCAGGIYLLVAQSFDQLWLAALSGVVALAMIGIAWCRLIGWLK